MTPENVVNPPSTPGPTASFIHCGVLGLVQMPATKKPSKKDPIALITMMLTKDMVKKIKLSMMSRRMRKAVPMAPPITTARRSFLRKFLFTY